MKDKIMTEEELIKYVKEHQLDKIKVSKEGEENE